MGSRYVEPPSGLELGHGTTSSLSSSGTSNAREDVDKWFSMVYPSMGFKGPNRSTINSSLALQSIRNPDLEENISFEFDSSNSKRRISRICIVLVIAIVIAASAVSISVFEFVVKPQNGEDKASTNVPFCDEVNLADVQAHIFNIPLSATNELIIDTGTFNCFPEGAFDTRSDLGNIAEVLLRFNDIREISVNAFPSELTNVFLISLEGHRDLTVIPDGLFDNLSQLTDVFLNDLGFVDLPPGLFRNNPIEILEIGFSDTLESIPTATIKNLNSLKRLSFRESTSLEIVEDDFFENLNNLISIDLTGTIVVQNECEAGFRVRTLIRNPAVELIGFNCINDVCEPGAVNLTAIQNQIAAIPLSLSSTLVIDTGRFSCFPEGAFDTRVDLGVITEIQLIDNNINGIENIPFPPELTNCALISFQGHPELEEVPDDIFNNLAGLREVIFIATNIGPLPAGIFNNNILERLVIDGSDNLFSIPTAAIKDVVSLKALSFRNSLNLEFSDDRVFENLINLESIDLTGTIIVQNECEQQFRTRTVVPAATALSGFSC